LRNKNDYIYNREDYRRLLVFLEERWIIRGNRKEKRILFDITGQFLPANNFYTLIALKVFSKIGYRVELLTTTKNSLNLKLFKILNLKIFYIKNIFNSILVSIGLLFNFLKVVKLIRKPSSIYDFHINDTYVGDLIVDEYARKTYKCTVTKIDKGLITLIFKAYYTYYYYKFLINFKKFEYIVINSNAYVQQGMLARLASLYGIKIIYMRSLNVVRVMHNLSDVYRYEFTPNVDLFNRLQDNKNFEKKAFDFFTARVLNRKNVGWDAHNFTSSRKDLSADLTLEFREENALKNIVLIAAPSLMDGIFGNYGKGQVYKDNYTWLVETLKICSQNENITVFLKPHPGDDVYPTKKSIDVLIELNLTEKIKVWPKEVDMLNLSDLIQLVVTSRGSVSREFPCLGVPVLVFGEGGYTGFNTVIEPSSTKEYEDIILSAHTLARLDEAVKKRAIMLYYLYQSYRYQTSKECSLHATDDTFKAYDEGKHLMGEHIQISDFKSDAYDILIQKLKYFQVNCFDDYFSDFSDFINEDEELHFGETKMLSSFDSKS